MTPDPKDNMIIVSGAGKVLPTEVLKALGTGVTVVTVDGPVSLPAPKPPSLESLVETLKATRDEEIQRQRILVQGGFIAPPTPPISGGHHNGRRRNKACHCGSGKKLKKCCGAPGVGMRETLTAMPPQKGMQ